MHLDSGLDLSQSVTWEKEKKIKFTTGLKTMVFLPNDVGNMTWSLGISGDLKL
jgi:hypothetical protein